MSVASGINRALLAWARGFDPLLKLNATIEEAGDRSLVTSSATIVERYIDDSKDIRLDFALVLVEPWSEGHDPLNYDAIAYGEEWLDWVWDHQAIPNLPAELLELEPDDQEPVAVMVMADSMCAKYQFQAHLTYRIGGRA